MSPNLLMQLEMIAQSLLHVASHNNKKLTEEEAAETAVRIVGRASVLGLVFKAVGLVLVVVVGLVVSSLLGLPPVKGTAALVLLLALTRKDIFDASVAKAKAQLVNGMFQEAIAKAKVAPPQPPAPTNGSEQG